MKIIESARKHGISDKDIEYVYNLPLNSIISREEPIMDNAKNVNPGTIGGEPITGELLENLSLRCEKDWDSDEFSVVSTGYGRAIAALQALDLPVEEIGALERRAQQEKCSLPLFLRSILQNKLAS